MLKGRITATSVRDGIGVERAQELAADHLLPRDRAVLDDVFEISLENEEVVIYYYLRDDEGATYTSASHQGLAFDTVIAKRKKNYDYDQYEDLIDKESSWASEDVEDRLF